MCGIAGIVDFRGRPIKQAAIAAATAALAHRGPDGDGFWTSADGTVALGHRRLAIIDTSDGGRQPMVSGDGRYVITTNGEIYNFLELRAELEALGSRFRSQSDTEVILEAYRHWGEGMLTRFNGMWAMAIHDTVDQTLFVARDRFGVKPLIYSWDGGRFAFASEIDALRKAGLVGGDIDMAVAARLLVDPMGVEGSSRTLYRGAARLQGGHCAWVSAAGVKVLRWWNTLDHLPTPPASLADQAERFRELFVDAVRLRMRSDVAIGTCLSGGFDSTAVICAMSGIAAEAPPRSAQSWRHAFVASFPGWEFDERRQAEEAAAFAGVKPRILEIGAGDSVALMDQVLDEVGETYLDPQVGPWLIYRAVRAAGVAVTLDGHGADELMGAYRPAGGSLQFSLTTAAAGLTSRSAVAAGLYDRVRSGYFAARSEAFLRHGLGPRLALVGDGDTLPAAWGPLSRRLYAMFHGTILPTLLRNYDRASMAHGVEARMPFMDWRLVCFVMSLPDSSKLGGGYTKLVAREALKGMMPEEIRTQRVKIGFNTPTAELLQGPLAGWTQALLTRRSAVFGELVDEARLGRVIAGATARRSWTLPLAQKVWPYLNLKHRLLAAGV